MHRFYQWNCQPLLCYTRNFPQNSSIYSLPLYICSLPFFHTPLEVIYNMYRVFLQHQMCYWHVRTNHWVIWNHNTFPEKKSNQIWVQSNLHVSIKDFLVFYIMCIVFRFPCLLFCKCIVYITGISEWIIFQMYNVVSSIEHYYVVYSLFWYVLSSMFTLLPLHLW